MKPKVERDKRPNGEDRAQLALWAADCAERVLPYFESKHPNDDRPRKAIEAARAWARGEIRVSEARAAAFAAHAAARNVHDPDACAAARAAGHAAATTHVPGHARACASYTVKAVKAATPSHGAMESDWQYHQLPDRLMELLSPDPDDGIHP